MTSGDGGVPTITAHAINTKGTGGTNGRMAIQACATANAASDSSAPACSISGDAPTVRFTVPIAALGDLAAAQRCIGTVTIVKGPSSEPMTGIYLSKKGYDYYPARGGKVAASDPANPELMVIATCDSTKLAAQSAKPMAATYDLAVRKK